MTDLYEVTMALAYLREGITEPATFSLFTRELPADRGFLVAAGLADMLDFLDDFVIDEDALAVFAAALERSAADLAPLRGMRFTGDVWAVPEGRVVLAGEPLLELSAPLPQAQLMETWVLNQISHQTALASKAARCVLAARGRPVVDFSLRRTHGVEAGMHAARAGAIVGFAATSNVAAAHVDGLRATGTMAHSFVLAFPSETAAFAAFARGTGGPVTLLVDTYDTVQGVHRAVEVLRALPADRDIGIRLDSGDLGALAVRARRILEDAGLARARIVASGGLDEYGIEDLLAAGAPVDVFAVGTKVGTAADAPYLDAAYKLVEYAGRAVMKLSAGKATAPGAKQVFRGPGCADTLALRDEVAPPGTQPLLEQVMGAGRLLRPREAAADAVATARRRFTADLAGLPAQLRTVRNPRSLHPGSSPDLQALTAQVRQRLATDELGAGRSPVTPGRAASRR
ncbi:nicotinate phosphoribosyltransferase [Pseudonocardia sp. H11422]|uniref:nicotinate phosphoribosyltransferase n=1 Tax=Pseudonocardia sp. H11422 TaxID=2835866 RepID=UPI0027E33AE0|nr:nicotinate phosphoribosyltransferase [Pseudonocardia sp. H11422]